MLSLRAFQSWYRKVISSNRTGIIPRSFPASYLIIFTIRMAQQIPNIAWRFVQTPLIITNGAPDPVTDCARPHHERTNRQTAKPDMTFKNDIEFTQFPFCVLQSRHCHKNMHIRTRRLVFVGTISPYSHKNIWLNSLVILFNRRTCPLDVLVIWFDIINELTN